MGIPRIFTTPPSATLENLIVVFLIQLTVGLACLRGLKACPQLKSSLLWLVELTQYWVISFIWPIRSTIATGVGPAFKHTRQVQATRAEEATQDSWCSNPLAFLQKSQNASDSWPELVIIWWNLHNSWQVSWVSAETQTMLVFCWYNFLDLLDKSFSK